MGETKRYYWLKLPEGFFNQKEIKMLRRVAGGETFIIIYLKMLLTAMKDDGKLYFEGYEKDFVSELALDIDEEVENVKITVQYLINNGILVENSVAEYEITTAKELTGSEGDSARRMRRSRLASKIGSQEALPPSQSDTDVTMCDTEIDIDKETEKSKRESKRFTPPTVDEVRAYVQERGYDIDAEQFVNFYESKGWMVGKNPMKNWRAAVGTWVSHDRSRRNGAKANPNDIYGKDYVPPKPFGNSGKYEF